MRLAQPLHEILHELIPWHRRLHLHYLFEKEEPHDVGDKMNCHQRGILPIHLLQPARYRFDMRNETLEKLLNFVDEPLGPKTNDIHEFGAADFRAVGKHIRDFLLRAEGIIKQRRASLERLLGVFHVDGVERRAVQRGPAFLEDPPYEMLLGLELAKQGHFRDAGLLRDFARRDRRIALLGKEIERRIHDRFVRYTHKYSEYSLFQELSSPH